MTVFGVVGQHCVYPGVNCLVIEYVGARHGFMTLSAVCNKPWR